jgi:hypothetical protein
VSQGDNQGRFDQEAWDRARARREARFPLIRKVNGWAAALGVFALLGFGWNNVYDWLMRRPFWVPLVLVGAFLGFALYRRWYDKDKYPALYAWTIAGFVLVGAFTVRAYGDASDYHVANCWHIEGTSDRWECAPGSEPRQALPGYNNMTDTETPGRLCDFINTTSSGGTIWNVTTNEGSLLASVQTLRDQGAPPQPSSPESSFSQPPFCPI